MTDYFNDVPDPMQLLRRERAPLTGRRVRKDKAKRSSAHVVPNPARWRIPVAIAAATVATAGIVLGVSAARHHHSARSVAPLPVPTVSLTTATTVAPTTAVSSTVVATTAVATTAAPATTTTAPATTVAPVTVPPPLVVHVSSTAPPTGVIEVPSHPGFPFRNTIVFPGAGFEFTCTSGGCTFSLREFAPGNVDSNGNTTIPVDNGVLTFTYTQIGSCSDSTHVLQPVPAMETITIELAVTGSQTVNSVQAPKHLSGAVSITAPDIGDVLHPSTTVSTCNGGTKTYSIDGDLTPVS